MDFYIGTKIIQAEPMTAKEAEKVLNRYIDVSNADEEGNGYLVKYIRDGYMSWSPKKAFEEAYHKTEFKMTFGDVLLCLKQNEKVARSGWNGKNMYLAICEGGGFRDGYRTQDFIYMKTAQDTIIPWIASQTDILAEDWYVFTG